MNSYGRMRALSYPPVTSQDTAFDRKIKERTEKEYEELKGRYDVQQGVSETKHEDVTF
jgi:hypothetical protein